MTAYNPPHRDMLFVIDELFGLDKINHLEPYQEVTSDILGAVLEEAGRFSKEVLAPLNRGGDREGALILDGKVTTATGFREAYRNFVEAGWNGLTSPLGYGGQGLPLLLGAAVEEMWHSSNMAFTLCPLLTRGAIEAIHYAGSQALKEKYLPAMVSGRWTGTMNLTEPQAGSDLAAVKTKAIPDGTGYRIFGQKIFITYGDHDFTENIIHLVLARLPDAPPGVKGLSLFVVPKVLVDKEGRLGEPNDVRTVSLEHKLGIHGSPTCVLAYGDGMGAYGEMLGEPNRGLELMFVMMNAARFSVGIQGLALAEKACQDASGYARNRVQGIPVSMTSPMPIVYHPDVRRMLASMKSRVEACRTLAYYGGLMLDLAHAEESEEKRQRAQERSDLLTPIVKGFCTEMGVEVATEGLQVFGGMGYIEETGAAQTMRDARITTIYEGTTGIQANDLLGRKLIRDQGAKVTALLIEISDSLTLYEKIDDLKPLVDALSDVVKCTEFATRHLLSESEICPESAFGAAVPYLHLMGWLVTAWLMLRSAGIAHANKEVDGAEGVFYRTKWATVNYFFKHELPRYRVFQERVCNGGKTLMSLDPQWL